MKLCWIAGEFTVCMLPEDAELDRELDFLFFAKTDQELSLVCRTECVPARCIRKEPGWKALRVEGELDFSLVGILAELTAALAKNKISVFAVSTYRTDYLLIKGEQVPAAQQCLLAHGYTFLNQNIP